MKKKASLPTSRMLIAWEHRGQGGNLRVDYATLKKIFGKPSINNGNGQGKQNPKGMDYQH